MFRITVPLNSLIHQQVLLAAGRCAASTAWSAWYSEARRSQAFRAKVVPSSTRSDIPNDPAHMHTHAHTHTQTVPR